MKKNHLYFFLLILILLLNGCLTSNKNIVERSDFVKGADVSWLPEMEKSGFKFYDNGVEEDCLVILKKNGINTIRLRTWVSPSSHPVDGHCSAEETIEMAVRAKKEGFKIMVDFHYSDSWADPGKQVKPKEWEELLFSDLVKEVYDYTENFLNLLKIADVTPDFVQIGNEINPGMLLPDGSSNNPGNLSLLINSGYDAVKTIFPNTQVVIHLSNGTNNSLFRWFFDNMKKYNTKYDVIGLSYYPYWDKVKYASSIDKLRNNMNDMVERYSKPVMVVETGGLDSETDETYNMLKSLIVTVKGVSGKKGLGVMYWEPEGASIFSKYKLSCWGDDGYPKKPLKAFIDD